MTEEMAEKGRVAVESARPLTEAAETGTSLLLRGVKKAFADVKAVDGLDLEVEERVLRATGAEWCWEDHDH